MATTRSELPGLDFQPADLYVIESLEELRTIANPLRIRILDCLIEQARTVKEVGYQLGIGSTKLYYHVGELEKVGLVRLVHTEIHSGIQVKYYRAIASYYYLSASMLHEDDRASGGSAASGAFLSSIVEIGSHELRRAISDGTVDRHDDTYIVSRRTRRMSPERAREFRDRLSALDREYRAAEDPAGELTMEFMVALFPKRDS